MVIEVERSHDNSAEDVSAKTESEDSYEGEDLSESTASSDVIVFVKPFSHQGMQHKMTDSWKRTFSTGYHQAMVDDEIETVCRTPPGALNNGSGGSIVSNLLRKASGFKDGMYMSGVGGGLEHKIQELRAEKEAGEMIKCPSSIHSDQDSPIDFSVKRRSSFSGSLTDDSQASLCSPGNVTDYNDMSPVMDSESVNHSIEISKRNTPSPQGYDQQKRFDHSDVATSASFATSPLLSMETLSGMTSNLLPNSPASNTFSKMAAAAAFVDPHNKKNTRPFKAYPKEALQMPLGFFGFPGLNPAAVQKGMESGIFAGMNSEDIVNLYNHQLHLLRDQQLPGQDGKTSPSSQVSTSNRNPIPQQHHHHQQIRDLNHRHTDSPSISYPQPAISISPPSATPDHIKSNHTSSSNYSVQATSRSLNATHVSSTSSFAHSNSRKRPRSLPDDQKDSAYWERRRKNNDAAKRSRDARRAKEDEIAIRAALLEQENIKLRVEVAALKTETARLRCLLYN